MRYEAKHSYFKHMAGLLGNFNQRHLHNAISSTCATRCVFLLRTRGKILSALLVCSINNINNSYSNLNKQVICNIGSNAMVGDLKYGTQLLDAVPALESDATVHV